MQIFCIFALLRVGQQYLLIFWTALIKRAQTAHIVFSGQSGMFMKSEPEEAESGSSHCQRRASGWMTVFRLGSVSIR